MSQIDPHRLFDAFLFDMDGTVLTSIKAAERVWTRWAEGHGIDIATLLATMHGMRAIDTVRRVAPPGLDVQAEADKISRAEIADVEGIEPIPGAAEFLAALPADRWAIVTSAPRALAERRIQAAGLPLPGVLVSADDVSHGKPSPEPFQLGAEKLGFDVEDCLIFEDAPAGIQAAETAGSALVVVTAGHAQPVATTHPTITDYAQLSVAHEQGRGLRVNRN